MFPVPCSTVFPPHNSFLTSLLILDQGKMYPPTNKRLFGMPWIELIVYLGTGWILFLFYIDRWHRFMGSTPSLLQVNVLFFAVDLIQMNSKKKKKKKKKLPWKICWTSAYFLLPWNNIALMRLCFQDAQKDFNMTLPIDLQVSALNSHYSESTL